MTYHIIAFTTKKDKNAIKYTDNLDDILKAIEPVIIPKTPKTPFNLDAILEKISKFGIDSLSLIEKDFLDGLKE